MVSDNVTTNAVINFFWVNPLVAAVLGAAAALIGREILELYKRPRFKIDFEEREKQKPYIPDYNDASMRVADYRTHRIKYLRLIVRNEGKKPAMDCEAKLEIFPDSASDSANKVALHWSRRDPELYTEYTENYLVKIDTERVFAPINLNIDDEETVDVFQLLYSFSTEPNMDNSPRLLTVIESTSLRKLQLPSETVYQCKVTIYSSNTAPKAFKFKVNWDGTLKGFNKAFKEQT